MSKSNYKKVATSAMAVAITATAVVPVVSAANTVDFTDVKAGDSHFDGVQWLASKGIVGYEDGSFGVDNKLTRPHAAIMFVQAMGLDLLDKSEIQNYFNDVDSNDLYSDYIATAGKAEIFKGSNGSFLPGEQLSREQMASTIVNAFDLVSNGTHVDINLDNVSETHKENVQILADLGITNQLKDFRPTEAVTRGQFATFLKLSSEKAAASEAVEVESVTALNTTVDKEGTLAFAINGKTESADLKTLKDAGYDVEFKANKEIFEGKKATSSTGKVSAVAGDSFAYQVVISKDGKEVAQSDRVTVKVEDYATAITEITSVEVQLDGIASTSGKLASDDSAKLIVKGKTKESGDKEVDLTKNVKYSTDQAAIATVNSTGEVIQHGAKGDVTITVKAGELTKTVALNAGNAAREVSAKTSSVDTASLLMGAGTTAEVNVTVKDQYGDIVKDAAITSGSDIASVNKGAFDAETNTYKVTVTAGAETKSGDVVLKAGEVEVGTIKVEVKKPGEVDSYKLTAPKAELDLNGDLSTNLTLASLDKDGFTVDSSISIGEGNFKAKTSDESVAKVENGTITATGTGNATITVYEVNGAFEDEVAAFDVTVIDSTPSITAVEFTEMEDIQAAEDVTINVTSLIKEITAQDPEGKAVTATVAAEDSDDQDNKLVIKDDKGNEIGTLMVVTSSGATFTKGLTELKFAQQSEDFADTIHVSILDNNDKIVGSTSLKISLEGLGDVNTVPEN